MIIEKQWNRSRRKSESQWTKSCSSVPVPAISAIWEKRKAMGRTDKCSYPRKIPYQYKLLSVLDLQLYWRLLILVTEFPAVSIFPKLHCRHCIQQQKKSYWWAKASEILFSHNRHVVQCRIETLHELHSSFYWQSLVFTNQVLADSFFPESYTGENIAEAMKSALEAWDLKVENQVCLITDNGLNIVKAASNLEWLRLSCFRHNLHLAITKALDDDQWCVRVLGICCKIVSTLSQSWKKKQELAKAQLNLGIDQNVWSLIALQDGDLWAKWWATFFRKPLD